LNHGRRRKKRFGGGENLLKESGENKIAGGSAPTPKGLGAEPPAAVSELGSGGGTSRAWRIFTY